MHLEGIKVIDEDRQGEAVMAEVPVIPLYYRSEISVTPKNMQGYRLSGHLYHDSNEIEAWNLGSTVK